MLIDFRQLFPAYGNPPKRILHVGASTGQEAEAYRSLGVEHVSWIEADPNVYTGLVEHVKNYPGQHALNYCISDVDDDLIPFYRTNNEGQSSSILKLGTHSVAHPDVVVVDTIDVKTKRLDTLFNEGKLPTSQLFDLINIDIQGAELLALKSLGNYLHTFKYAYLEVNRDELYLGCARIDEIDKYMKDFGFIRVETKMFNQWGWGDCFMINQAFK